MQYGWTSPIIPILLRSDSPIEIKTSDIVWIETVYTLSKIIGLPFVIFSLDEFGRKTTILLASCTSFIGWIVLSSAETKLELFQLFLARILFGLASSGNCAACPKYILEIGEKRIRGFLITLLIIMFHLGIVVIYSVAPFVSIMASSFVGVVTITAQLLIFLFMPETPHYLVQSNQIVKAKKTLMKIRRSSNINEDFIEIMETVVERNLRGKWMKLRDLFKVSSNFKALKMIMINITENFGGASVIIMNLHSIVKEAEITSSTNVFCIYFSIFMFFGACFSSCVIKKVGKKLFFSWSFLLSSVDYPSVSWVCISH